MTAPADAAERLAKIEELRMLLSEFIGDDWGLLAGISDLATGRKTPAEVQADLEEYM